MELKCHGQPCLNFCFARPCHIPCDPYDGREKVVLSTRVEKSGLLYIYDPAANTVETHQLPDSDATAMIFLPEYGRLVIGTTSCFGYILSLDLKTRTWAEPLRFEDETHVWNFARAKDGRIYGSDYPMCRMYIYDPETMTLTHSERMSDNQKNMYCRYVAAHPDGNIVATVINDTNELYYYDVETQTKRRFGIDGDRVFWPINNHIIRAEGSDGVYRFYDPDTLELVEHPVSCDAPSADGITDPRVLAEIDSILHPPYAELLPKGKCKPDSMVTLNDGTVFGTVDQEIYFIKDGAIRFAKLPCQPPSTNIHGLAVDETGRVWFSAGMGQTIGWYEPTDGTYWNSDAVTWRGGEVYGIVPYQKKIYLTAYVGGDHVVYDPQAEWNQRENINPVTLQNCFDTMVRPIGRSILGPDGNIWTGWSGVYGKYGGGLTRIHTDTHEVDIRHNIIPLHSHCHLTASDKYVYSVTNGETSGLRRRMDEFYLLRHDMEMNVVWSEKFPLGQLPAWVAVVGGKLFLLLTDVNDETNTLRVYDEVSMELLREIPVPYHPGEEVWWGMGLLKYDDRHVIIFIGTEARLMDVDTYEIVRVCELPGVAHNYAVAPDKTVYFLVRKFDNDLYSLRFDD